MSKIELRGVIVPSDYDTEWAQTYIERGMITPESYFRRQLDQAAKDEPLEIHVNSPGGSVFAGNEMINAAQQWKTETGQPITATVGAMAASMASGFVVAVPDSVKAHSNAKMMFHGAYMLTVGGSEAHADGAALLEKINADVKTRLVSKYNLEPETVSEWFAEGREGWLSAEDMKAAGIASEIIGDPAESIQFPTEAINDFEQRGLGIAALIKATTEEITTEITEKKKGSRYRVKVTYKPRSQTKGRIAERITIFINDGEQDFLEVPLYGRVDEGIKKPGG